nr:DDE-type integrase/transposase/recombinase [Thermosporothrix hazakensis]
MNQVWEIDIRYIRLQSGWMYLVAILDWFSRYVIDWKLDQSLELPFVFETVSRVQSCCKPEIMNSNQGSHFTSTEYIQLLKTSEVRISMDGKNRAVDNIFYGATLAQLEIRGSLLARVRFAQRSAPRHPSVLRVLLSLPTASVAGLSDTCVGLHRMTLLSLVTAT